MGENSDRNDWTVFTVGQAWEGAELFFTANGPVTITIWAGAGHCIDVDDIVLETCSSGSVRERSHFVKVADGNQCPVMGQRINSESECIQAADFLGLQWAHSWNGVTDVPGCIFANDGRSLVYWNSAEDNNRPTTNPRYAEVCRQSTATALTVESVQL